MFDWLRFISKETAEERRMTDTQEMMRVKLADQHKTVSAYRRSLALLGHRLIKWGGALEQWSHASTENAHLAKN